MQFRRCTTAFPHMKSHTGIMLLTMPCFCIDFILNVSKKPSGNKKNKIGLIVAIFVGAVGVLSFLFVFVVFFNTRKRKNLQTNDYDGKPEILYCTSMMVHGCVSIFLIQ